MARIVSVGELGDPARLSTLAEAIFGAGDRPAGWFARKLARERVDAACSMLAIEDGGDVQDPGAWLGYVLVGLPESLGDAARTSGTGVIERARGRGVATALLDAAAEATAAAARRALQLLADPQLVDFYRARRFAEQQRLVTLVRPSRGPPASTRPDRDATADAPAPEPVSPPLAMPNRDATANAPPSRPHAIASPAMLPSAWLPEAWSHTQAALRELVRWADARAFISREGRAILVHHLEHHLAPVRAPDVVALADALLQRLPAGHPVVLPLLHEVSTVTEQLVDAGWHVVQRGVLLQRTVVDQSPG